MFLRISDSQLLERRDADSGVLGVVLSDFVVDFFFFTIFPCSIMMVLTLHYVHSNIPIAFMASQNTDRICCGANSLCSLRLSVATER